MARIPVNATTNLLTGADTLNPRTPVEITVPRHRLRFHPSEARQLAQDLMAAVEAAARFTAVDVPLQPIGLTYAEARQLAEGKPNAE